MTKARLTLAVVGMLTLAACRFYPDFERLPICGEDGSCEAGAQCWTAEWRCVPECGEDSECAFDAGIEPQPVPDAGEVVDAGETDAGVVPDSGTEQDGGAPDGGPVPLTFDAGELPRAVELEPYAVTFQAFGGTPPYTFARTDGGFPSGLVFGGDGQVTGSPTEIGGFPMEVRVVDQSAPPNLASGTVTLLVSPLLRIANPPALADALNNSAYQEQLYATGGTLPYLWTLDAGSALPGGVQLNSNGSISGTFSGTATHGFGVVVTDSDSPPQQKRLPMTITVRTNPLGPEFFTRALADGRVGTPYDQQLRVSGGTAPLTISQTAGSLPPGIARTGAFLSGAPSDAGTYNVTFQVDDSLVGSSSRSYSIKIY